MNSIRSSSRAISFLMRTLILTSHASFAPFVLYEPIIFFLSGHLYKISQQSQEFVVGNQSSTHVSKRERIGRRGRFTAPIADLSAPGKGTTSRMKR